MTNYLGNTWFGPRPFCRATKWQYSTTVLVTRRDKRVACRNLRTLHKEPKLNYSPFFATSVLALRNSGRSECFPPSQFFNSCE